MLIICRPIFGSGKAVVLDDGFFVDKGVTNLEDKGIYEAYISRKRRYYQKGVPEDLIDT